VWGASYLLWLSHVHHNAYYSDFRNKSVRVYERNDVSHENRIGEEAFNSVAPPPVAPVSQGAHWGPTPVRHPALRMNNYYDSSGGCFTPDTVVWTATGPVVVRELSRGAVLEGGAVVRCVTLTACDAPMPICRLATDVGLTPTHPFSDDLPRCASDDLAWTWPYESFPSLAESHPHVFNLVLDRSHYVIVGQERRYAAITLAHGRGGPVLAHEYYGTDRVLDALQADPHWSLGVAALPSPPPVRNAAPNDVVDQPFGSLLLIRALRVR
jgi:hypothetical protein